MHLPFPDIGQFKNCVKAVRDRATFVRIDENNEVVRDPNAVMPKIKFLGTPKLHGCLSGETLITLANGEKEKLKNIRSGDSILSYDEARRTYCFNEVLALVAQDLDKDWLELTFENGAILQCTEDHLILTDSGWKEAKSITSLDEIISDEIN